MPFFEHRQAHAGCHLHFHQPLVGVISNARRADVREVVRECLFLRMLRGFRIVLRVPYLYVVLQCHRAAFVKRVDSLRLRRQLCGHAHGGQQRPFV